MKAKWNMATRRFNALGRRERIMIFAAAVFAVTYLGYQFAIEPHMVKQASVTKNLVQQRQARVDIESGVTASEARARAPDALNRAALQDLRDRIVKVESEYHSIHDNLVAPEKMALLTETLLRRNRGLQLVSMTTLPASPIVALAPAAAEAKAPGVQGMPGVQGVAPAAAAGLYKHGVRIVVRGTYADMTAYLLQLEQLPQKMYWGSVEMLTQEYPVALLQFTVYTLSASKSWLVI
jgi:MSHA biogenesis protein MshJ